MKLSRDCVRCRSFLRHSATLWLDLTGPLVPINFFFLLAKAEVIKAVIEMARLFLFDYFNDWN